MRSPDPFSRLEAYKLTHQAWVDQAVLAVSGLTPAQVHECLPSLLAAAYAAGQAQDTPPTPVDWQAHLYERYVRPCHAIMVAAGQTPREPDTTTPAPLRRIIRRRS